MTDTSKTTAGPSAAIAAFATRIRYEDIPVGVLERARIHILDGLGLAIASGKFPFAGPALAAAEELGTGPCTVIGSARTASLRDAAMANGLLIHGLDYDDTHLQAIVHPTCAVLPTVLAIAEQKNLSGRDALTAFCVGMEVAIRMGAAINGGMHHTGFHATGVIAHFSSAVAAGVLMGASERQHIDAIGIAGSTASGIQVFLEEGAWTKRLHPGWAAAGGITAATLARHGFVGPTRALEGRFGLFETHLHEWKKDVVGHYLTDGFGETWMMSDTALKPYPVCHFIHGAADAALELHRQIAGAEIETVDIYLARDTMKIVAEPIEQKRHARNEYEAKFSAPFVVAATLLKGRFGLPELTEEAIAAPDVQALSARCACHVDPDSRFPEFFSGGVRIKLRDGRELACHVPVNSGAGERKMTLDETTEKFLQNTGMAIDDDKALKIRDAVVGLAEASVPDLMAKLRFDA